MGFATFIGRLFGRPAEARDDYVRSTIRFMELDRERIKRRLNLEAVLSPGGRGALGVVLALSVRQAIEGSEQRDHSPPPSASRRVWRCGHRGSPGGRDSEAHH